ncbi:MAG TPA: twin-arginine translocase TatA/TatE family subunit [Actinomycetaceae bacterium]|nr:twin-arginine translocase TatA/TatE family subunit [Actinomycetaceae bacterium]
MFGINGWEALVLLLLVLIIVGPNRLPETTRQIAGWFNEARDFLRGAKEQVSRELGDEVDLASLDPRQYDPRRIVREALFDEPPARSPRGSSPAPPMWTSPGRRPGVPAPFDDEAT